MEDQIGSLIAKVNDQKREIERLNKLVAFDKVWHQLLNDKDETIKQLESKLTYYENEDEFSKIITFDWKCFRYPETNDLIYLS